MIRRSFAVVAVAALLTGPAAAQARITLVLDASWDMATELDDGQPRIEAVRSAVGAWISEQGQPALTSLGLITVGGTAGAADAEACSDIRVLIEPGAADPEAWSAALDATQPSGSRALTKAVIAAAEGLPSEAETAFLIVITSGEDDCDGDDEAAAAALAGGVSLRVIGIGLSGEAVDRFSAVAPTRNATAAGSILDALRSIAEEILAEQVAVEVPAEVAAGNPFEVVWDGPAGEADFLSVANPDSDGDAYLNLYLAERGSPATLKAPSNPGIYEVRYVDGRTGKVFRRSSIEVSSIPVAITTTAVVRAGGRFEVKWTGPNLSGDFIAVAQAASPARRRLDWFYASPGIPATLAAPFKPGEYEIRYVSGASQEVLAAVSITVEK